MASVTANRQDRYGDSCGLFGLLHERKDLGSSDEIERMHVLDVPQPASRIVQWTRSEGKRDV
jgi:hypothetical protein